MGARVPVVLTSRAIAVRIVYAQRAQARAGI